MKNLHPIATVFVLSILLLGNGPILAKEIEDQDWIEVRTPNFLIRSMLKEKKTVELAEYLEMFRVVASMVTSTALVDAPVPTEIYAIEGRGASKSFGVDSTVAGFFRSGLRRNTIVVRNTIGMSETAIIMHEYVHFLIRNHGSTNYPMWFHEGFAEYLSSAVIEDGIVTIGNTPEHRISSFKFSEWINVRQIITRNGGDAWGAERSAMFYAESWALVHYLQNREDSANPFGRQLQHYVRLLENGDEAIAAFEEAFEISMRDLDKGLYRYVSKNRIPGFRFELDAVIMNFEPEVRSLEKTESSLALGNYSLTSGSLDEAERLFNIAATDAKYEARAEAGLGDVQKFQDEFDAGQPHFERALELAPDDPYGQLDMAEYWHDRAVDTDDEDLKTIYIANARTHYLAAWKLDNKSPETFTMWGETFLVLGDNYTKAVGLLKQAQTLLPSSMQIRLSLAKAYLGAEQMEEAANAARSYLAWSHGQSDGAKEAQEILAEAESTASQQKVAQE